jgi:hypothetical protein
MWLEHDACPASVCLRICAARMGALANSLSAAYKCICKAHLEISDIFKVARSVEAECADLCNCFRDENCVEDIVPESQGCVAQSCGHGFMWGFQAEKY